MTQRFSLYEDLSIEENLDFIARVYALSNRKERVEQSLEQLGLVKRKKQLAGNLSGGWKQRLALAAALIHDPKLLLLDEPTAGVDPGARREFWDHIHELSTTGITTLVSTHYMDEAERCHRLAYFFAGRLLTSGTPTNIIRDSGLTTWSIQGKDIAMLYDALKNNSEVEQINRLGNLLHICGKNQEKLNAALKPFQENLALIFEKIVPTLEEVFISLSRQNSDNRYD